MKDPVAIADHLEAVYRRVPDVKCKGKCAECCGPILCGGAEWARIVPLAGAVAAIGGDLSCPLLKDGRCSVYAVRPLICRLWGAVKAMRCPHGCRPSRWLSDAEARDLLNTVADLSDGRIGGPVADACMRGMLS